MSIAYPCEHLRFHSLIFFDRSRCAFTLLETLAVIVIMGMAMGIATWSLGAAADASKQQNIVNHWRVFDQQARTLALRTGRPVQIEFDNDSVSGGSQLIAHTVPHSDDRFQIRFDSQTWSESVVIELMDDREQSVGTIQIDPDGRSCDYTIVLTNVQDRRGLEIMQVRMSVVGLTGRVTNLTSSDSK